MLPACILNNECSRSLVPSRQEQSPAALIFAWLVCQLQETISRKIWVSLRLIKKTSKRERERLDEKEVFQTFYPKAPIETKRDHFPTAKLRRVRKDLKGISLNIRKESFKNSTEIPLVHPSVMCDDLRADILGMTKKNCKQEEKHFENYMRAILIWPGKHF